MGILGLEMSMADIYGMFITNKTPAKPNFKNGFMAGDANFSVSELEAIQGSGRIGGILSPVTKSNTVTTIQNVATVTVPSDRIKAGSQLVVDGFLDFTIGNDDDNCNVTLKAGSQTIFSELVDVSNGDSLCFRINMTAQTIAESGVVAVTKMIGGTRGGSPDFVFESGVVTAPTNGNIDLTLSVQWSDTGDDGVSICRKFDVYRV